MILGILLTLVGCADAEAGWALEIGIALSFIGVVGFIVGRTAAWWHHG
jgi:hypothetical protein